MSQSLFFIALLPPAKIRLEVTHFKEIARDRFQSKKAFNAPPHITLIPPFKFSQEDVGRLKSILSAFAEKRNAFLQKLKNFDAFPPRVIYVDVVMNEELKNLQADLEIHLSKSLGLIYDRPKRPYRPHMTIAFKDLKKYVFPAAWKHFSNLEYDRIFEIKSISLLKHENGKWREYCDFFFDKEN